MRVHSSRTARMSPRGGGGRRSEEDLPPAEVVAGWVRGRVPDAWFTGTPEVTVDRDAVLVVGRLEEPEASEGATPAERAAAADGRAQRFREETRAARMRLADEVEHRFGRKTAWGVEVGGQRTLFTVLSVPVMTRLRQPERLVLDTLVEAGVARSRSDALAWCVKLVGKTSDRWLAELRESLASVQRLREQGPEGSAS